VKNFIGLLLVVCWARIPCSFGPPAECRVYAEPFRGQRCDYVVFPDGVECRGYDAFGNWVVYGSRCPAFIGEPTDLVQSN
jgi:hypothetical protein